MNRDIIYGWMRGYMVRRQRRTALLAPASAAISNRHFAQLEITSKPLKTNVRHDF
jgi:hypothetical protein